jgi:hypothetical protein
MACCQGDQYPPPSAIGELQSIPDVARISTTGFLRKFGRLVRLTPQLGVKRWSITAISRQFFCLPVTSARRFKVNLKRKDAFIKGYIIEE